MGAKEAFVRGLRELVLEMPYSKVTVTELCRKTHLSRKTFYDNFQDKEGVLEAIVHDSFVKPIITMNEVLSTTHARDMTDVFLQLIYDAVLEDREFFYALVRPMKGVDDTFLRVTTHEIESLNHDIIPKIADISDLEKEYIAYYFAAGQSMLLQKWIFDGMPMSSKELADLYKKIGAGFWLSL